MLKIFVNDRNRCVCLTKRPFSYSIIKGNDEDIVLNYGWNEFTNLKDGFYLESINNSEYITQIDLSEYNTREITNMSLMFSGCLYLKELCLDNFNTSNVVDMFGMFSLCVSITKLDLSKFDTRNVRNMGYMFYACDSLVELDLSNFTVDNVNYMTDMFQECNNLKYIKCKRSFKEWCIKNRDEIDLPKSMREGGNGIWDIVK